MEIISFLFIFGIVCFIVKQDKGFHSKGDDTDYLEIGILIPHWIQGCENLPLTFTCILKNIPKGKHLNMKKCVQTKKRMYVLWKMKLFLCISLADISSSAALICASTLSFWNPGNSLLTGFFIGTLILYKPFFAHRIHIASCQPLPLLKTNHIPGLTFFNGFPLFLG